MRNIHIGTFRSFPTRHRNEQPSFAINNLNIMHYKAVVKGYRCVRPQLPFYRKLANPYLRYLHNFLLLKL